MRCEKPMTLVQKFLIWKHHIVRKHNDLLHSQRMKLNNELLTLELNNGSMNQPLVDASKTLYFDNCKMFKARLNRLTEHPNRYAYGSEIEALSVRCTEVPTRCRERTIASN